jgi:hypothetical protein
MVKNQIKMGLGNTVLVSKVQNLKRKADETEKELSRKEKELAKKAVEQT